ncbi:redox-sensitive transcriptional activator SoxR [Bradyrhizobium sp. BWA-3-5]|uniref:redox-sensitive transcriptional activator SoxR n=1 Tax=Bradyrhizobium sp. BWA-3-5 TaxID=3080013 RepID=UPI00293F0CAC|nr:redox-sensitive transcriptional activator SoxR [Bradyrhizobium sp. BWA-3-5]WOH63110.1 redox-sensitive transcriptional activator SoxR [Bradyrhizobium sp. BWA-3-5]
MEWTVGELSRRSGISISAIHFYERKGLIASRCTTGNQHRYETDVLRRISIIRIAQEVGIPLAEVAHHFGSLPKGGHATRRDWERISRLWANDLDRRIVTLQKLRANLGDCTGCGCLSLDRCNLLNPDDRLSSKGAGPARLKARRPLSH